MTLLDDYLTGSGAKAFFNKESPLGSSVTGKVKDVRVEQSIDPKTNEPETWPDNNPKNRAVIILQTDLREPSEDGREDNGDRAVYVKLWGVQKKALGEASREAGGSPAVGDTLTVTLSGYGPQPSNKMYSPAKLYTYKIVKGSPLDGQLDAPSAPATPQAAATPTAPATPTATPQAAAPATSTGVDAELQAKVAQFINIGLTDAQIAQALSIDETTAAGYRVLVGAASGAGF